MNIIKKFILVLIVVYISLFLLNCQERRAHQSVDSEENYYRERFIATVSGEFLEVNHIKIKGSNYAIGKKIAEITKRLLIRPKQSDDIIINRIQRKYIKNNYPEFYERMRGVADVYGIDINDDNYDFSHLWIIPIESFVKSMGCSVVFYPKSFTENSHDILSRNFDFIREPSIMSKIYIMELYPDKGYASLSICSFDLLGGTLEGVNSEGLVVAVLAEEETMAKYGNHPALKGVGTYELLALRYLLDKCGNVEEAKEALLYLKHFYTFMPCHFIIADRQGKSFIFEFSSFRNSTYIVKGHGIQWVTNHPLHNQTSISDLPEEIRAGLINTYKRYKRLEDQIKGKEGFSLDEIIKINNSVANSNLPLENFGPLNRTLWHSLYDLQELSLKVKFYLDEKEDNSVPSGKRIFYSDYLKFSLQSP